MAGRRGPAYAVLALAAHFQEHPLPTGIRIDWRGEGEWKITLDVFRDLGIAFSAALLGIYVLLVYETGSFLLPVVIMLSIPLTMIGIMPGFWLLNLLGEPAGGRFRQPGLLHGHRHDRHDRAERHRGPQRHHPDRLHPQSRWKRGTRMREAILESGAVRFRPIFLTAGTTMLGAWPITLDPIFSGLAWSIIFGMFVSTAFTLIVVPTVYSLHLRQEAGPKPVRRSLAMSLEPRRFVEGGSREPLPSSSLRPRPLRSGVLSDAGIQRTRTPLLQAVPAPGNVDGNRGQAPERKPPVKRSWPDDLRVHVVSHTHWDREWRMPVDFFFLKLQRCIDQLLAILDGDPEYKAFLLDGQMVMVEDYLRFRPEREADIRRMVQAGRLLIGPWYTLVDNNLIDGESIVRNLLVGAREARAFGEPMSEGYLISSFGHNGQMPQVFAGFGIESVLFSRGISEWQVRSEFRWRSPDGTAALALHLPDRYTKSNWYYLVHRPGVLGRDGLDWKYRWPADFPAHCCDAASADNYWFRIGEVFREDETTWAACAEALVEKALAASAVPILLAMDGVDHLFPTHLVPRIIRAANDHFGREVFVHSTLPAYVRDVRGFSTENRVELETVSGEMRRPIKVPGFNQLLAGTVSARMPMKLMNHAAETALLRQAEPLSTMAWLAGDEYPHAFLDEAWKLLMQNHAHDGICGTSIDAVHDDMAYRYARVRRTGEVLTQRALQALVARIDTRNVGERELALAVFNPGMTARTEVVRAVVDVPYEWGQQFDPDSGRRRTGHPKPRVRQAAAGARDSRRTRCPTRVPVHALSRGVPRGEKSRRSATAPIVSRRDRGRIHAAGWSWALLLCRTSICASKAGPTGRSS